MKVLIAVFLSLSYAPQSLLAPTWTCKPDRKVYCDASGCRDVTPDSWSRFNIQSREYSRCDQSGCAVFPDAWFHFGDDATATVSIRSDALMLRVDEAMNYTEAAGDGLGWFISTGSCEEDAASDQQ